MDGPLIGHEVGEQVFDIGGQVVEGQVGGFFGQVGRAVGAEVRSDVSRPGFTVDEV